MRTALALVLAAAPAAAQQMPCGPREVFIEQLEKAHQETLVARAMQSNGLVMEILASPNGTYTILLSRPDGLACAVSDGSQWGFVVERPKGRAS